MMTSGCTINGKHFVETHAWGASRYTRRVFIDGKMVTREVWLAEMDAAKKSEAAVKLGRTPIEAAHRIEELEAICKPIRNLETGEDETDPNYSAEERKAAAEELAALDR